MNTYSGDKSAYAHFIGVGGAGMSALALVLLQRGVKITGSDMKESRYTRKLQAAGMDVCIGHDASNVGNPEIVVISTAISEEKNPELREARRRNLPVWKRAQMLAEITKDAATLAVAGTHGKTSTSSMLANSLEELGKEPGFCIGGEVGAFSANAREGSGELYVVEADESDGSFVWLKPHIAVITNLKPEHVDHYDSYEQLEQVFVDFMNRVSDDGLLVVCGDDEELLELSTQSGRPVLSYGASEHCDIRYSNFKPFTGKAGSSFSIEYEGQSYPASITLPGEHMASNATAVFAVLVSLGIDPNEAAGALGSFQGVRRRFEFVGECAGVSIVDDYGHHPTEIAATLKGAKDLDYQRIVVVFQPHRYSRTQAFEEEFGSAFDCADLIILTDIFSSGETPIPGVSGRTIVNSILEHKPDAQVVWLPRRKNLSDYLCAHTRAGDLLITMGAGDITGLGSEFVQDRTEREAQSMRASKVFAAKPSKDNLVSEYDLP